MSRLLPLLLCLALFAATAASAKPAPSGPGSGSTPGASAAKSWAHAEIKLVVSHGLMATSVATFYPEAPLTQGALSMLVAGLTGQPVAAAAVPAAPVTVAQLDARLVRALGLSDAASSFYQEVAAAGLAPPSRFGTETVARLLGLRTDHPARADGLELLPNDLATRAEAAYSAAQILRFGDPSWRVQNLIEAASTFTLPQLGPWQRRVLTTAVRFIGFPYVWGGTSETTESPLGVPARGGFDCSGFVWRVYKLQQYTGGAALATTIKGRTTYAMSGEVSRTRRIPFSKLQPGDVLFWGAHGRTSVPGEVDHTGIYLGSGWFIHSSEYGVALAQLQGWYKQRFAWARRPLLEAGLVAA